jgi:hypothetical protein
MMKMFEKEETDLIFVQEIYEYLATYSVRSKTPDGTVHHTNSVQITYGHTSKYASTPVVDHLHMHSTTPDDGRRTETCRIQCFNVLISIFSVIMGHRHFNL